MSRKIGYYKNYNQAPEEPISITPEIYVDHNDKASGDWYITFGTDRGVSLNLKELVAFRDALTKAIEDYEPAVARVRKRVEAARAQVARLKAEMEVK